MVKVKAMQPYYDREQDKNMFVGDQFECTKERANLLTAFGVVSIEKKEVKVTAKKKK